MLHNSLKDKKKAHNFTSVGNKRVTKGLFKAFVWAFH